MKSNKLSNLLAKLEQFEKESVSVREFEVMSESVSVSLVGGSNSGCSNAACGGNNQCGANSSCQGNSGCSGNEACTGNNTCTANESCIHN
jgi:hypothetical protein